MTAKVDYPVVKKVLWRYARVFVAGFVGTISVDILLTGTPEMLTTMLKAAVVGGISALFKFVREEVGADDYENPVHRLPL